MINMIQYDQIIKFLKALDKLLSSPSVLTVIGGSAMVLGYKSSRMTSDIDSWMKVEKELLKHWDEAKKHSGVNISIDTQAGVAQMPEGAEERFEIIEERFKNLTIRFPEKYDLAISKLARLQGNDMDDIIWLYENYGLEKDAFLKRYKNEFRPSYVGQVSFLDLNFLDVVEELFGKKIRIRLEIKLIKRIHS